MRKDDALTTVQTRSLNKNVEQVVTDILISVLRVDRDIVKKSALLVDDLGADWYTLMIIEYQICAYFNIYTDDFELTFSRVCTVNDLIKAVEAAIAPATNPPSGGGTGGGTGGSSGGGEDGNTDQIDIPHIRATIEQIIIDHGANDIRNILKLSSEFYRDLGFDELDFIETIMKCEESLGVSIPDEEAYKVKNVADLINLFLYKLNPPKGENQLGFRIIPEREEILNIIKYKTNEQSGWALQEEDIHLNSSFEDDFGFDELDSFELNMKIGMEFNIEITDAEWDGIHTIGQVFDLVVRIFERYPN